MMTWSEAVDRLEARLHNRRLAILGSLSPFLGLEAFVFIIISTFPRDARVGAILAFSPIWGLCVLATLVGIYFIRTGRDRVGG